VGILIAGLVLFLGIHLVPALPAVRNLLFEALGENKYKGLFSIVSAIGLALIVVGYARAPGEPRLFNPFPVAVMAAPLAMVVSFVLLASANMRTHIRRTIRHPMLIGVGIWAAVHLLANGEAKATLLFGAFLAYAVIDLASALQRNVRKSFTPVLRQDVMALIAGVVLSLLVMLFHRPLFGAMAVAWGR
jgi:uncharacterized membrane protein